MVRVSFPLLSICSRVKDVECHMHHVREKVEVALRTTSSALGTERLLVCEAEQEQPQVMEVGTEGRVIEAGAFAEVGIVPE